jgi:hypothetical protein
MYCQHVTTHRSYNVSYVYFQGVTTYKSMLVSDGLTD